LEKKEKKTPIPLERLVVPEPGITVLAQMADFRSFCGGLFGGLGGVMWVAFWSGG